MNTGLLIILLFVVIAVAVSQLGVILFLVNFLKKNDLHDGAIKDAQEKSASVIADAVARSNDLVAKSQQDQIEKVTEESKLLENIAQQFEQTVTSLQQTTTKEITETAQEASESVEQVAKETQETLQNLVATDRKVLEEKTDQMINQSSQVFQQFMTQLSGQIRNQLAGELEIAKKEIEVYKKERIATINEKIIDILEETLVATLGKKLSLKDEGEFVFQALETAKKEHVL